MKKPWKIEHKTADGFTGDVPSSWQYRENAEKWVESHVQAAKDEGFDYGELTKTSSELVTVFTDGFNTFTVYHVDSVYYS